MVVHDVRMHDGDDNHSPIKKHKHRKKSDSDSHCVVDAINDVQ